MVSDTEIKEKVKAHREAKQESQVETTIVSNEDLTKLIQEAALKKSKAATELELQRLKDRESSLAKELSDKYGQGSLDLETGKFTTTK